MKNISQINSTSRQKFRNIIFGSFVQTARKLAKRTAFSTYDLPSLPDYIARRKKIRHELPAFDNAKSQQKHR